MIKDKKEHDFLYLTSMSERNKGNNGWECTYRVWDVANSMHPDFPRNRKRVDPVQWDSVLIFQQVGTIYCHLWAKISILVSYYAITFI